MRAEQIVGPKVLRAWLHEQLDPRARPFGLSHLNLIIAIAILLSVALAAAATEPDVAAAAQPMFDGAEFMFGILFGAEYLARLWIAPDMQPTVAPLRARLRWMFSSAAVVDLLAVVSGLIGGFAPAYILRLVRILRMLRIAKLGRFSSAWSLIAEALRLRVHELTLTLLAACLVLLVSSTALYLVEGPAQPEQFGSIPRALWWSVVTLTTVGYGDVYPSTPFGKVLAGLTALVGVGLVAAPTGILAASFSDAIQRHRREADTGGDQR